MKKKNPVISRDSERKRRRVEKPAAWSSLMSSANRADERPEHHLKFRQLAGFYAIVRLAPDAALPDWATKGEFTSITRTAEELSIVRPTDNLPREASSPHSWICFKLEGPFPFSLTGVLLSFIEPFSNRGIPIFAISTFDTDYVLVQEEFATAAIEELQSAGHELWRHDQS